MPAASGPAQDTTKNPAATRESRGRANGWIGSVVDAETYEQPLKKRSMKTMKSLLSYWPSPGETPP